jgi:uncharacterized repeat protein (TIGR03803 family)
LSSRASKIMSTFYLKITSSGLVQDKRGNLYGTTIGGDPNGNCPGTPQGCGVVFKLDPNGDETALHTFTGGPTDMLPYGDPLLDEDGNLYGVASNGGDVSGFCGATILKRYRRSRVRNSL